MPHRAKTLKGFGGWCICAYSGAFGRRGIGNVLIVRRILSCGF